MVLSILVHLFKGRIFTNIMKLRPSFSYLDSLDISHRFTQKTSLIYNFLLGFCYLFLQSDKQRIAGNLNFVFFAKIQLGLLFPFKKMSANFLGNSVISFDFPDSNADRTRSYNVQKTGHIDRLFAPSIKSNIQIFIGKCPCNIFNSCTRVL